MTVPLQLNLVSSSSRSSQIRRFLEPYEPWSDQGRSQGVARVAKATPILSKKNYKAKTTYSIYNIHIAH